MNDAQTPCTCPPIYIDGEPANLPAAAADAWIWLETLREYDALGKIPGLPNVDQHRANLGRCCAALAEQIRRLPPSENRPRPSGVVLQVVAVSGGEAATAGAQRLADLREIDTTL